MRVIVAFISVLLFSIATPALSTEKLGVVLMHGKMGSASAKSPVGKLASYLRGKGIIVVAPDMPWSKKRRFDKDYEASMLEIDKYADKLRKKGATKIVIGGHSIGANAALGYGARREGLAGVLAIAPGHIPDVAGYQKKIKNDWQRAKKMVDAGKGNKKAKFRDRNQGKQSKINMKASVYLSWFDPKGPAAMPNNAVNLKKDTPLLWIIGEKDVMHIRRGENYAYTNAPETPHNAYVVVKGGHKATPQKGKKEILSWLQGL